MSVPPPPPLLPASHDRIDLWLCYYDRLSDPLLLDELGLLMNPAERAQQQRFYFADDRLRYLVTRALVRTVLSRYDAVAPAAWEFTQNAYGRPEIAPGHGLPALRFNLSHTRGLIALAVGGARTLGVDVENLAVRQPSEGIAEHFFSAAEVAALGALPPAQRGGRFFEYWTFKEAYIKARGMGLSLPLDRFSFHLDGADAVSLEVDDTGGGDADDASRWLFWQCRPGPDYLLALCAERLGATAPALTVRHIVPTRVCEPVAMDWLRCSPEASASTRQQQARGRG